MRRRAQQRQPTHASRVVGGDPHPHHPAERDPGEVHPSQPLLVEDSEHVVREICDARPRARRGRR
jgi:hypothetical protein